MKVLIVRFSSFGDVLQTLSVVGAIRRDRPDAEIHWVTRRDMLPLVELHPALSRTWTLDPATGWAGLWNLARSLRAESYTHVYDAHNNLRSRLLIWLMMGPFALWGRLLGQKFLRRSQFRWKRFLLFQMGINTYPQPFSGQGALLAPLKNWGFSTEAPPVPQMFLDEKSRQKMAQDERINKLRPRFVSLAPSAAHELKRWPVEYWQSLVRELPQLHFVALGGPGDDFISEIQAVAPDRVLNLAGKLSFLESAAVVEASELLITNDTSLLHVAEQIGKDCVALMGPAPFGFPSRPRTRILERKLKCRPCSKHGQGPCVNPNFQECLRSIRPSEVAEVVRQCLNF